VLVFRQPRLSLSAAAELVERAGGSLDNLLVTAAEIEERPRPLRAEIREEIARQAGARLARTDPSQAVPLLQPIAVTLAVAVGCLMLVLAVNGGGGVLPAGLQPLFEPRGAATATITVRVTPPAYTRRASETFDNPVQVTVIQGSRVRIESDTTVLHDQTASESAGLVLRANDTQAPRFLSLIVVPDAPPSVRISAPAKDLAFAVPRGRVALAIESADDLGLTALTLRFTKASGGGENVSFTEGEVPLAIKRTSGRQWRARAEWPLDGLGLADGDILVYHALARDANPRGSAVPSDQFIIEIGRNAEIASAGFALPTEEKKYAISQQMVIYKTEQLLDRLRPGARLRQGSGGQATSPLTPAEALEESRGLAIEQRMVRAEVVFLSGGEVQDEVEEAAHSHELAEGRLENQGRAEMIRAINFMSRAEAELNGGRAAEALVFERQALASLERALDRRRYFLRTLPDRSRIDLTRRLTGNAVDAETWIRFNRPHPAVPALDPVRQIMREVAASVSAPPDSAAPLAARVAAVNPASAALQTAAVAMASASSDAARHDAARAAMQALTAHALTLLGSPAAPMIRVDPLAGHLADILGAPRPFDSAQGKQ
jgi:hypothetical protein